MKKYLASALLALGLILNVEAQTYTTTTYIKPAPVPDNGSTAVLLGVGLLGLALASRRLLAAR
jgi:hypothetical protein